MQGGKNCILLKEINANRFFWDSHWLDNCMVKPLLSLYGTEWRERGYGLCTVLSRQEKLNSSH
jgi:hypothetical protein